jgi:catechol 2,3-dioxygenase-like lactoylglutathione lyase family enzyme
LPITNPAAAGIRAFYFQGPALHPLELISYPKGKGEARWQVAGRAGSAAEVLGIDHTAIAVSNTDRSKHFYTELLGLRVAGTSLNSGAEQAALSGVPDPRVRITTLRGESGPGIELLEYESPRRGRLTPRDTRANDAWRCVITLAMTDLTHTVARLRAAGTPIVSGDIREAAGLFEGGTRAVEVLDPDGHALRLVQ